MRTMLWVLWALAVIGCGAVDKSASEGKPTMRALGQKAVVKEIVNDEEIGREIRRRLDLADPAAGASVIIEVIDGKVTLRGTALTIADAWQAEAAARATPGVEQVANQILVQEKSTGFGE